MYEVGTQLELDNFNTGINSAEYRTITSVVRNKTGHISFSADDIDLETNVTKNIKLKVTHKSFGELFLVSTAW